MRNVEFRLQSSHPGASEYPGTCSRASGVSGQARRGAAEAQLATVETPGKGTWQRRRRRAARGGGANGRDGTKSMHVSAQRESSGVVTNTERGGYLVGRCFGLQWGISSGDSNARRFLAQQPCAWLEPVHGGQGSSAGQSSFTDTNNGMRLRPSKVSSDIGFQHACGQNETLENRECTRHVMAAVMRNVPRGGA